MRVQIPWGQPNKQNSKENRMTWCADHGYKVGDLFIVNAGDEFTKGSVVELEEDDNTDMPRFKLIKGRCAFSNSKTHSAGAFCKLYKISPLPLPEFKVGDRVVIQGGFKDGSSQLANHSVVGQMRNGWADAMGSRAGTVATVVGITTGGYRLEGIVWGWMPHWLEAYIPSAEQQLEEMEEELNIIKAEYATTKAQLFAANQKLAQIGNIVG
jgi:hypothetical protein